MRRKSTISKRLILCINCILLTTIFACFAVSCGEDELEGPDDDGYFHDRFMQYFIKADAAYAGVKKIYNDEGELVFNHFQPRIACRPEEECPKQFINFSLSGNVIAHTKMQDIAESIGDDTSGSYVFGDRRYERDKALVNAIVSLTVTCDKDLDTIHTAGSTINDCLTVRFEDAYNYVLNGYRVPDSPKYYGEDRVADCKHAGSIYIDRLSDVIFSNHPYHGSHLYMTFDLDSLPADSICLTFRAKLSDGGVYETTTGSFWAPDLAR